MCNCPTVKGGVFCSQRFVDKYKLYKNVDKCNLFLYLVVYLSIGALIRGKLDKQVRTPEHFFFKQYKTHKMNLEQIKQSLSKGEKVYWSNMNYEVIKSEIDNKYYIHSIYNDHWQGLTHTDGITLNGEEHEFFYTK